MTSYLDNFVVQAGLNQPVTFVRNTAQLVCKDSLLVGWGGATDQDSESSSVVHVSDQGAAAIIEGCTLQYHPDSKHMPTVLTHHGCAKASPDNPLPGSLVVADEHGHVDLSECQLVGPTARVADFTGLGIRAGTRATIHLVGVSQNLTPGMNMLGPRS
jgi:hypothetical protein